MTVTVISSTCRQGSGGLSESGGGNSSRSLEPSNSPEVDSPGNHLNGNERNQNRVRHSRPPASRPSVATLGESSTDDSDLEDRVHRREQPPRLQQQGRSRDSGDPSNIEASTEKPGDDRGSHLASDLVGNEPTDDGGRSTVDAVDLGRVGLRRSSARSLVNEAEAAGEAVNGGTRRGRSLTVGECDLVVASSSLSGSEDASASVSASQQLPALLDAHGGGRGNERMARTAELAGRLRAVVSGEAREAGLLLSVAVPVAELAPASASEHSSEDPQQRDSALMVESSSTPRYSKRRGNMEPLPDGPPAVGDDQAHLAGVEARGGFGRDAVERPSGGLDAAGAKGAVAVGLGGGGAVSNGVGDGYRGAEAYAKLLIVEHTELYLQQQVGSFYSSRGRICI